MRLDIQQNTPEWLDLRRRKIGASDAPVIAGISPYTTPYQLWQEKLQLVGDKPQHAGMRRGHALEVQARGMLEQELGIALEPAVLVSDKRSWMMASIDAASLSNLTIAEIKCPGAEDHEMALNGRVPPKYFPQLQHQIEVCHVDVIYYYSFDGEKGVTLKVFREENYIKNLLKDEERFLEYMQTFEAPPFTERDFVQNFSSEWQNLAEKWHTVRAQMQLAEHEEEKIRKELIALAHNKNTMGAGLKVSKLTRKGNVDYSKIPSIASMDLEPYRKQNTQYWKLISV